MINAELQESIDESLEMDLPFATRIIDAWKAPHTCYLNADHLSTIKPVPNGNYQLDFKDTSIYKQGEFENYRILHSYYSHDGLTYKITLFKTTIEKDELMEGLLSTFMLITAFLVIAFFIVNWLLSKKLWKPFYQTLDILTNYDIQKQQPQIFNPQPTFEFNQLNAGLAKMTMKIHTDFIQLKEFTENASHEMQTPLAVAKANLSLLLQSSNLKETEMDQLQTIENSLKQLSSLHKTLMLLAKIENNQFAGNTTVDLRKTVMTNLERYADFIKARNIQIHLEIGTEVRTIMDPALADILISNLLQNALWHNIHNGEVFIRSEQNTLSISNTGNPLTIKTEELFLRFKKDDPSSKSLGLGLAIVKSIVSLYDFEIIYACSSPAIHTFTLKF
jgi:signal transduction histidine kinase